MIDAKTYLGVLKRLPPFMRALLGNEELTQMNLELEEQHRLSTEQGDAMMGIIRSVVAKETSPHHVLVRVKAELNLPDDRANGLTRDILGRVLLPMERYLGGVHVALKNLGGSVDEYLALAKGRFPEVYGLIPIAPKPEPEEGPVTTPAAGLGPARAPLERAAEFDDESLYAAQENILQRVGANADELVAILKEASAARDRQTVVACLELLSRFGALELPLQQPDLRAAFADEFLKPLAQRQNIPFANVQRTLDARTSDPPTIAVFVLWLLKKALPGNDAESARIGNQIAITLSALGNTGLVGMTYFDVAQGGFRWTPVRMKPDGSIEWIG